jgi:hypothetical protein
MSIENTKIYPINTGWVVLDRSLFILQRQTGRKMDIPNTCYYVDTGEHKIMVDTGLPGQEHRQIPSRLRQARLFGST